MTSNRLNTILLILFAASALIFSCKKGSVETDYNPNIRVANNQVIAERAFSEVFNIFFMVVNDPELKQQGNDSIFGAYCTYAESPEISYRIDFSPYYGPCPDGKIRKGVITATLNQDFNETGAIATLLFSGYAVEHLELDSTMGIWNLGITAGPLQTYEVNVAYSTLTFVDSVSSKSYNWSSNKFFVHSEGNGTPFDFSDDVFDISGVATGRDVEGVYFQASIEEFLGNHLDCRWIRTGRTLLTTSGLPVASGYIDYIGQDSCTNIVKYTFNGNPFYDKFRYH